MAGELGRDVAEELKPRLDADEQRKLQTEPDEVYDERVLTALETRLQPEIEAFNQVAPEADQIALKKSGGMLKISVDEKPSLGVIPKNRQLLLVKPSDTAPSYHFHVSGGPEEFSYTGVVDGRISPNPAVKQDELLKGIFRLATGKPFEAERTGDAANTGTSAASSTGFYR